MRSDTYKATLFNIKKEKKHTNSKRQLQSKEN